MTLEQAIPNAVAPAVERQLTTGERFRTIKVFYEPRLLVAKLAALGRQCAGPRFGWLPNEWRCVSSPVSRGAKRVT
jgi:hypothetical protein